MVESAEATRNRDLQAGLYGEPLGPLLKWIAGRLGLNQARLAQTVGLSAPMLSQLISAQRVKIGNPAVLQRIRALRELALAVDAGDVSAAQLPDSVEAIRASDAWITKTTTRLPATPGGEPAADPRLVVQAIQTILRAAASADELGAAAALLDADHPRIAELLRVYGTGRTDDAIDHYRSTVGTAGE